VIFEFKATIGFLRIFEFWLIFLFLVSQNHVRVWRPWEWFVGTLGVDLQEAHHPSGSTCLPDHALLHLMHCLADFEALAQILHPPLVVQYPSSLKLSALISKCFMSYPSRRVLCSALTLAGLRIWSWQWVGAVSAPLIVAGETGS